MESAGGWSAIFYSLKFRMNERVVVRSATNVMFCIIVREIDIPPGNAVMYYPEANHLIDRNHDPLSKTPAFKNVLIEITRSQSPCEQ